MSKSAIGALLLGLVTVTGFTSFAQAASWDCPMPITKGGCPVVLTYPARTAAFAARPVTPGARGKVTGPFSGSDQSASRG